MLDSKWRMPSVLQDWGAGGGKWLLSGVLQQLPAGVTTPDPMSAAKQVGGVGVEGLGGR
jgi:hypothetical protein